mmetsp:Transcript_50621/g.83926  ORF Transcript_50621/g.83926 Transcript_50621/m.83926 type:complete len:125 (+) Transcript_50621:127-501(+)
MTIPNPREYKCDATCKVTPLQTFLKSFACTRDRDAITKRSKAAGAIASPPCCHFGSCTTATDYHTTAEPRDLPSAKRTNNVSTSLQQQPSFFALSARATRTVPAPPADCADEFSRRCFTSRAMV